MTEKSPSRPIEKFRDSPRVGEFLRAMFQRFNEECISYCVLHSYERLPEFAPSDVDIAIDGESLNKAEYIIYELADSMEYKVIQMLYYDVPKCFYYVLFFRDANGSPGFIQIDLMNDDNGIGRYLMKTAQILAGRRQFKEFYIPAAPVVACYLLIKKCVKGMMPPEQKMMIKDAFLEDKDGAKKMFIFFFGKRHLSKIEKIIYGNDSDKEQLKYLKIAAILKHRVLKPQLLIAKVYWLIKRTIKRIFEPTGIVVNLTSPDGGGKSAVADELSARMRSGFRRVDRMHWRPNFLRTPRKFFNPSKWNDPEPPNYSPHALPPRSRLSSIFRFLFFVADYVIGFLPCIQWPKIRTGLVICERYYYDFLIDLNRFRLDLPLWLPSIFLHLIPKPDLTILLTGSAQTIFERKQEISLSEIKRQLNAMETFSSKIPNIYKITIDQPFLKEISEIEDLIVAEMSKRLRIRLGK